MNKQNEQDIRNQLREKILCLNRMVQLGKAQSAALHAGSGPLLTNLTEMAKLIREVNGIDRILNPLKNQLTTGETERFLPETRKIKILLQQMMTLEKESIHQAKDKMADLRREMHHLQKGRRVVGKYTKNDSLSTSHFLDLREG
ncbi:MAG: hypothetical protein GXP58_07975 [Deltaproteobacteria bacterium]|nr:hypothetical protein [Deltaproteobacteria bacterium]